jgi:hypothetical protein
MYLKNNSNFKHYGNNCQCLCLNLPEFIGVKPCGGGKLIASLPWLFAVAGYRQVVFPAVKTEDN